MTDVACLGILVADIFASAIHSLPGPGQLRLSDRFLLSAGGCAVNTAACLRRMKRSATVLGKVGQDLFGDFVVRDLERMGIDASHVRRSSNSPTSSTFILNVRGEDRRYIHCIGANADFGSADIEYAVLDRTRALYVGGYLAMPGLDVQMLIELLRAARQRKLLTVLDVVIPAESERAMEQVAPAFPHLDAFLPNEDEARMLTGCEHPMRQIEDLTDRSPETIFVITRGKAGAVAGHGKQRLRMGSYAVNFVDGSGAGDAFASGFLTGMLENWPLEKTLRFASAVGASCTRALGCTEGVFQFEEALSFIGEKTLPVDS